MAQKLITKKQLAELAGVGQSAVTKLVRGRLAKAMVGDKVNANSRIVKAYLAEKHAPKPEAPASGIDPLFEDALHLCSSTGRWSKSHIQRELRVDFTRAARIYDQLVAAGHTTPEPRVVPGPTGTAPPPPPPPRRKPSGQQAARLKRAAAIEDPDDTIEGVAEDFGLSVDDVADLADQTFSYVVQKFGTGVRMFDWLKALKEIENVNEKRIKNAQAQGKLVSRDLVKAAILDRIDGVFIKLLTDATTTISSRAHAMSQAGEDEKAIKAMVEDQLSSFIRPAKDKMREALSND